MAPPGPAVEADSALRNPIAPVQRRRVGGDAPERDNARLKIERAGGVLRLARKGNRAAKGAEFVGDFSDQGWGITTRMVVPGAGEMTLYQPKYDPPATSPS